jgi:hypothetical protein
MLAAHPEAAELNVRAGEHLAGIVLTAFNGPPATVDTLGGIDFVFRRRTDGRSWMLGNADVAAVEVKSSSGLYRRREPNMTIGDGMSIPVKSVVDLLAASTDLVMRAVAALARKADPSWSRHVYLLFHPFDGIAQETLDSQGLIANHLPAVNPELGLDSLWVQIHSLSSTARWSSTEQRWSNMVFAGWSPEDGQEPDGLIDDMQDAEDLFLSLVDYHRGSPWMFGITAADREE